MTRAITYFVSVIVNFCLLVFYSQLFGQSVSFDCPATASAKVVQANSRKQLVEIVVPVSVANYDSRLKLNEVKIDVFWNRNPCSVVDYAPKTELQSDFDGPIIVESRTETKFSVGSKISSDYLDFVSPSLSADFGKKSSESRRFSEIPEQYLTLASGTTRRGTGAFFTFKQSRLSTLEGSRKLRLVYEVPATWRGGILQVKFESNGRRKKFAGFKEGFEFARVFMVSAFVEGDIQARLLANQFARSEQQLRYDWEKLLQTNDVSASGDDWRIFGQQQNSPALLAHQLIQSNSEKLDVRMQRRMPKSIARSADQFVDARKGLLAISH